jgi:hypothetical protein
VTPETLWIPTIEELAMSQHRLLFYSNLSRSGTTVELNEDGNIVTLHDFAPGSLGAFTHIVGMT